MSDRQLPPWRSEAQELERSEFERREVLREGLLAGTVTPAEAEAAVPEWAGLAALAGLDGEGRAIERAEGVGVEPSSRGTGEGTVSARVSLHSLLADLAGTRPAPGSSPEEFASWLQRKADVHDAIAGRLSEIGDVRGAVEADVLASRARVDAAELLETAAGHRPGGMSVWAVPGLPDAGIDHVSDRSHDQAWVPDWDAVEGYDRGGANDALGGVVSDAEDGL
jgi:hypothetical protein